VRCLMSDAKSAVFGPSLVGCRSLGGRPPRDHRRTLGGYSGSAAPGRRGVTSRRSSANGVRSALQHHPATQRPRVSAACAGGGYAGTASADPPPEPDRVGTARRHAPLNCIADHSMGAGHRSGDHLTGTGSGIIPNISSMWRKPGPSSPQAASVLVGTRQRPGSRQPQYCPPRFGQAYDTTTRRVPLSCSGLLS
jgi:hypothetical protein